MSRIVFVNGRYVPYGEAAIHVEDRGFQFADSVYEVIEILDGNLVDEARHIARLERSLKELSIALPMSVKALGTILRETIRRNKVTDGSIYLQISRGSAKRDFIFPAPDVPPTIVCVARPAVKGKSDTQALTGISVITMPDIRWARPDIKTTGLLPQALAREAARQAGAKEAWLVDNDGYVTEGAASNAWIVDHEGRLRTRPAEKGILRGITRSVVIDMAKARGIEIVEEAFLVAEALNAEEAFVTAATALIMPVVRIDGQKIGDGKPGKLTKDLRKAFHSHAEIAR